MAVKLVRRTTEVPFGQLGPNAWFEKDGLIFRRVNSEDKSLSICLSEGSHEAQLITVAPNDLVNRLNVVSPAEFEVVG